MSELNKQIDDYILAHPKMLGEVGYYGKVAAIFSVHPEKVRKRWRQLKDRGQALEYATSGYMHVSGTQIPDSILTTTSLVSSGNCFGFTNESDWNYGSDGDVEITAKVEEEIKTLEDLIRVCEIDVNVYDVKTWKVKSYNAWIKNKAEQIETKKLFSVAASLTQKKIDTNANVQKDYLLEEIKAHSPYQFLDVQENPNYQSSTKNAEKKQALEINIPDLHIGKLAWGKETGEDYDIKIAVERYKAAVDSLLSRVNIDTVEKIILPVGNDLIHVDTPALTTTGGTYVNSDSRFGKMFQTAKTLLIETIEKLSLLAPVDVIIIPGNHDQIATFTLGEVLDAWFHGSNVINVINAHTPRKYYQYGQTLIMYTHGHREKLNDLGIICATEEPQLWAATKYRRCHVGHFHHSKQVKFVDVQEFPGFTVKILNSLSATDAWHAEKGFLSLKAAEAFLYDRDKGLVGNFFHYND
jgi:hypothetical protein